MLSDFSSLALHVLLRVLPDLASSVSEYESDFEIIDTCPAGWNLRISSSSEDDVLTVEFAEYHGHFGGYAESVPEKDALEVVNLIQSLITENTVLIVYYNADEYFGSEIIDSSNINKISTLAVGKDASFVVKRWSM